ncbi:MAG: OmpA family protein [bacterium]
MRNLCSTVHPSLRMATAMLALCTAAPLLAQTAGTTSGENTAPQNAQVQTGAAYSPSSTTPDASSAIAGPPLSNQSHEGFWGHLNPFARKKWVRRDLAPIKDRLNELDQVNANDAQRISDLDRRTQAGIAQARSKAEQADQTATTAGNTAQQAQQMAQQASTQTNAIGSAVQNLDQYQTVSRVVIRFRNERAVLGENSRQALDQLTSQLSGQRGWIIDVRGYSHLRGTAGVTTSRRLAQAVTRYLVTRQNVPLYKIHQLGLGNPPAHEEGWTVPRSGGVVAVTLMHNSLSTLNASSTGVSNAGAAQTGTSMQ